MRQSNFEPIDELLLQLYHHSDLSEQNMVTIRTLENIPNARSILEYYNKNLNENNNKTASTVHELLCIHSKTDDNVYSFNLDWSRSLTKQFEYVHSDCIERWDKLSWIFSEWQKDAYSWSPFIIITYIIITRSGIMLEKTGESFGLLNFINSLPIDKWRNSAH